MTQALDRRRTFIVATVAVGATALVLGPSLRPGYTLSYDLVFVPHLPWSIQLLGVGGGPPRAVPSDALVSLASTLVPGWVVEKVVLVATLALAGLGAGRLVGRRNGRALAPCAAALAYIWNPYVFERLVIGHWTLLIGYAALPWAVGSVRRSRGVAWPTLALASVAAAVGGAQASVVFVPVVLAVLIACPARHDPRWPDVGRFAILAAVLNAPWWVPGVLGSGTVRLDPASVAAFAPRADTALGTVGSLLSLGGVWNAEVAPPGRGSLVVAAASALLVVVATAGLARSWRTLPHWRTGLVVAAGLDVVLVVLLSGPLQSGFGHVVTHVPGAGLLRDSQKLVGPLALVWAVGLAGAVRAALDLRAPAATRRAAALVVVALPVAVVPALMWGCSGRLGSVWYPPAWTAASGPVAASRADGALLVLPWGAYRRFDWNADRVVLDPAPRWFGGVVFFDDRLAVGPVTVGPETGVGAAITAAPDPSAQVAAAGAHGASVVVTELPSATAPDLTGEQLDVVDVTPTGPLPSGLPVFPVLFADVLALVVAVVSWPVLWLRGRSRLLP